MVVWVSIALMLYFAINTCLIDKHKAFYPHPALGLIRNLKSDDRFSKKEKFIVFIIINFIYLPIVCLWFIAWASYKLIEIICKHSDDKSTNIFDDEFDLEIKQEAFSENFKPAEEDLLADIQLAADASHIIKNDSTNDIVDTATQTAEKDNTQGINQSIPTKKISVKSANKKSKDKRIKF